MAAPATRYAPPASIRGSSLREVREQQKANKELEELLQSESPYAGVKAFAHGLVAGSVMPLVMQSGPLVAELSELHRPEVAQARLVHWLQTKGIPEARARAAAPGVFRILQGSGSMDPDAEDAVRRAAQSGFVFDNPNLPHLKGEVFGSKQDAVTRLEQELSRLSKGKKVPPGWTPGDAAREMVDVHLRPSTYTPPNARLSDIYPSREAGRRVMDAARESFEAAGKQAPRFRSTVRKHLPRMLMQSFPAVATLGLVGGIANVLRTKEQRKELQELRRASGAHK